MGRNSSVFESIWMTNANGVQSEVACQPTYLRRFKIPLKRGKCPIVFLAESVKMATGAQTKALVTIP